MPTNPDVTGGTGHLCYDEILYEQLYQLFLDINL